MQALLRIPSSNIVELLKITSKPFYPLQICDDQPVFKAKNLFESNFEYDPLLSYKYADIRRESYKKFLKFGYIDIPEDFDGLNISNKEKIFFLDKFGMYNLGLADSFNHHLAFNKIIKEFGHKSMKEKYLKKLGYGQIIGSLCFNDLNCEKEKKTTLQLVEKKINLNGGKKWVPNGDISSLYIILTEVINEKNNEEYTNLLMPFLNKIKIQEKIKTIGLKNSSYNDIKFDYIELSSQDYSAFHINTFEIYQNYNNYYYYLNSISMRSVMIKLFKNTFDHVSTRIQFNECLLEIDDVKFKIARMASLIYNLDTMIHFSSEFIDVSNPLNAFIFSILKVYSTESAWQICDDAMQLFGGRCYMKENIFEEIMRDILTLRSIGESNIYCRKLVIREGLKNIYKDNILRTSQNIKDFSKVCAGIHKINFIKFQKNFNNNQKNFPLPILNKAFDAIVEKYIQMFLSSRSICGLIQNEKIRNLLLEFHNFVVENDIQTLHDHALVDEICSEIVENEGNLPFLNELF